MTLTASGFHNSKLLSRVSLTRQIISQIIIFQRGKHTCQRVIDRQDWNRPWIETTAELIALINFVSFIMVFWWPIESLLSFRFGMACTTGAIISWLSVQIFHAFDTILESVFPVYRDESSKPGVMTLISYFLLVIAIYVFTTRLYGVLPRSELFGILTCIVNVVAVIGCAVAVWYRHDADRVTRSS